MSTKSFVDMKNTENLDNFNSSYAAVLELATAARLYMQKHNYVPLASEAIHYVLTGEEPEIVKDSAKYTYATDSHKSSNLDKIDDVYHGIDDVTIRQAVKDSVTLSLKKNNLIYKYNELTDEYSKTRVRVATRMIFDLSQDGSC